MQKSRSKRSARRDIVDEPKLFDNQVKATVQMDRHLAGTPAHAEFESLLTVEDVCSRLRVSKSWVYREAERGSLPHIKVGKVLRFQWSEVMASLKRYGARSQ